MALKLKITNRSDWPDEALEVLGKWICKREGISWNYEIVMRDRGDMRRWSGRGGRFKQTNRINRRCCPNFTGPYGDYKVLKKYGKLGGHKYLWPYLRTEHRFKDGLTCEMRSRLELLVFLLSHEACHATDGSPTKFRTGFSKRRTDAKDMENVCNIHGARAILALRDEWPALREQIRTRLRQKRRDARPDVALAKRYEHKLVKLNEWRRKQRSATLKVKKYEKSVKYYEQKIAATSGDRVKTNATTTRDK